MKNRNPEFDTYIAEAAEFARPILHKLRKLFHKACPDIEETIKWGFPHFEYRGVVGSMAAFKRHVSFGFWKEKLLTGDGNSAMFRNKVTDVAELPTDDILLATIREAVALNEQGVKVPKEKKARTELEIPDYFLAALKKNKKAKAAFEGFSYSHKKEYVEWVTEAKQEVTRAKRLATALEWLAEGKPRNWKYMEKK